MKIPKKIKTLLKKREDYAMKYLSCESELNDWLDRKGIFNECTCGDHSSLFNTGVDVFTPGSAATTIDNGRTFLYGKIYKMRKFKS